MQTLVQKNQIKLTWEQRELPGTERTIRIERSVHQEDLAIILLGIYPGEMKMMGYFYTSVAVMVHESTQVTKNSIEMDTQTASVALLGLILDCRYTRCNHPWQPNKRHVSPPSVISAVSFKSIIISKTKLDKKMMLVEKVIFCLKFMSSGLISLPPAAS